MTVVLNSTALVFETIPKLCPHFKNAHFVQIHFKSESVNVRIGENKENWRQHLKNRFSSNFTLCGVSFPKNRYTWLVQILTYS